MSEYPLTQPERTRTGSASVHGNILASKTRPWHNITTFVLAFLCIPWILCTKKCIYIYIFFFYSSVRSEKRLVVIVVLEPRSSPRPSLEVQSGATLR